ncbi:ribonuclease H-like domain-containing protein [Basfia succiniciproducens]|uniref:ribonuclease H-like domain-containing protein n=1 Tax=Basfia succiniciproducens TaxID=653940 RepID=UPI003FCC3D73
MKIYIDIETIPTQNPDYQNYVCENLKAPGNYKNADAIEKWLEENKGEAVNKTALDGAFGEIVVIGVAIDDEEPVLFYREDWQSADRETDILTRFNNYLREHANKSTSAPQFIGHNITKFDDRFIFQRSVVNGVKPYYTTGRQNTYDTMTEWAGYGGTVSLDKLCKVLDVEQKGDIDGSKVWQYVQDGKINEVAEYCAKDVERVRRIYKRMTFTE